MADMWTKDSVTTGPDHLGVHYADWYVDVERYGEVLIRHAVMGTMRVYSLGALIDMLLALRLTAQAHFGEDWGK